MKRPTKRYTREYTPAKGMLALRVRRIVEETVLVTEEELNYLEGLYYRQNESEEEAEQWLKECALADRNYFNGTFDDVENKKAGYGDLYYPGILEVLRPDDTKLIAR